MRSVSIFLTLLVLGSLISVLNGAVVGSFRRDMDFLFRNEHLKRGTALYQLITTDNGTVVGSILVRCGGPDSTVDIIIQADGAWQVTESYVWIGTPDSYPDVPVDPLTFPFSQIPAFPGGHFSVYKDIAVDTSTSSTLRFVIRAHMRQMVYTQASLESISSSPPGSFECGGNYIRNIYTHNHDSRPNYYLTDMDGFLFNSWIVNSADPAVVERPYLVKLISSYSPVFGTPEGLDYVDYPGNLSIANYIVNRANRYLHYDAIECTWKSIQNALLYFLDANPAYLTEDSNTCIDFIKNDAASHVNFVPPCPDGTYLVIAVPVDKSSCQQRDIQVIGLIVGGMCFNGQCQVIYENTVAYGVATGTSGEPIPGDDEALSFTYDYSC